LPLNIHKSNWCTMSGYTSQVNPAKDDPFSDWVYELPASGAGIPASQQTDAITTRPPPANPKQLSPPTQTVPATGLAIAPPQIIPFKNKPGHYPALIQRSGIFSVARADAIGSSATTPASTVTCPVRAQGGYELTSAGPRLTQHDKSVWKALVDLAKEREHDLTQPMRTSLSEIARRCGAKFTGSRVTDAVSQGIQRMCLTQLTCKVGAVGLVSGRLLAGHTCDAHGTTILFDPELTTALLGNDLNFKINADRRRSLDTALAQWLHDFVSTHEQGRSLTLGYLRDLMGFAAQQRRFPAALNAAMLNLKSAAPELVADFTIEKATRDSDMWTLSIQRGPEAPAFIGFHRKTESNAPPARKTPKRGGVAL
jgi:hypothetical protein